MKLTYRLSIIILVFVVFTFAACKKSASSKTTTTQTPDYKAIGSQMAFSIYQSVTGGFGNVNFGKSQVKSNALQKKGMFDASALCGTVVDSTYTTNITSPDTVTGTNSYQLTYTCNAGKLNGYTAVDTSTTSVYDYPYFHTVYVIGQHFNVSALDTTFTMYSLNGISYFNSSYPPVTATQGATLVMVINYASVGINSSTGTGIITGGTATFSATQTVYNAQPLGAEIISYTGVMTFIGNNEATVVFSNDPHSIYTYNIVTGQRL